MGGEGKERGGEGRRGGDGGGSKGRGREGEEGREGNGTPRKKPSYGLYLGTTINSLQKQQFFFKPRSLKNYVYTRLFSGTDLESRPLA
jgi:hypothetical protein